MRSVRKRSILYVCEHFEHEHNEENTFLDDYLYKKSHPCGQERIYKTLTGDLAKKTRLRKGFDAKRAPLIVLVTRAPQKRSVEVTTSDSLYQPKTTNLNEP